jgi:hypothetical protein
MVRFEKDKFIIEVISPRSSFENWKLTFDQMIDALQADERDVPVNKFFFLELLREMLPSDEMMAEMQKKLDSDSNE